MKMHYVINARMPSKKAHGIQSAQTCQAFIEEGVDLTLLIPRTRAIRQHPSLKSFYKLRVEIPTVTLPALDWYDKGKAGFIMSSLSFMFTSFFYLLYLRVRGAIDVIYSVDTNTFSLALLPFTGIPTFAEIHVTKPYNVPSRIFFAGARGIITLNSKVKEELAATFCIPQERFIVEPCGVEDSWFDEGVSKQEARQKLSIPQDVPMAVYVGRFYHWKGLSILPPAFALLPEAYCYVVGGGVEQFLKAADQTELPKNIRVMGECHHFEVPLWHAAADVFVVPWPRNQLPYHEYGSPMKLLECMAARKPLVSADHVTITSVVPRDAALLYRPGDERDLAQKIRQALQGDHAHMVERAYRAAKRYTLKNRAERTKAFIEKLLH